MIKRLASAFIIITIILSMLLSSAGTVLAFANEADDTVPDSEEKIESEAADVTALTEKIAQMKAIDNIEDKYNLKTVKAWLSKAEAAVENKVQKNYVYGMWVSYYELENMADNGFFEGFEELCKTAAELGVNTLYVHIKAMDTLFYNSNYLYSL